MSRTYLGRVVTPTRIIDHGVVVTNESEILWVGDIADLPGELLRGETHRLQSPGYVLPGLVDLHNHGGAGVSFANVTDADEALTGVLAHRGRGTTRLLASTVSSAPADLIATVTALGDLVHGGELEGVHAEGPYLSTHRCGAQDPAQLRPADPAEIDDLVAASRGSVRTMTIAPEVPGAAAGIEQLVRRGVIPSLGHTDAEVTMMRTALQSITTSLAPARGTVTHLFNGMAPMHHRKPGSVPAAIAWASTGQGVVELIGDGVHLVPEILPSLFETIGADNIALITDAMAAAGLSDGTYHLGPQRVTVAGGVARLAEGDSIAGGTSRLIDVVRVCVQAGVDLVDAVRSASWTPGQVLRAGNGLPVEGGSERPSLPAIGGLVPGHIADILLTDQELEPVRVWRGGVEVTTVESNSLSVVHETSGVAAE